MTSHFHIPGSFEPHALTGVHPNVFRPPTSPSSSSYLPPGSALGLPDPPQKRKRDSTRDNTPVRDPERRYVLAGQIDTPGGPQEALEDSVHSDVAYRRQMGPAGEVMADAATEGEGWRSVALGAIGGVVGRVWEFCKAGAFRGFYAGGGKGYAMDGGERHVSEKIGGFEDTARGFVLERSEAATGGFGMGGPEGPVRGFGMGMDTGRGFDTNARRGFDLDFSTPALDTNIRTHHDPSPSQPSAKRRHVNDELGRSWVMVDDPARRAAAARRSRNRNSSPSVTTGRRISAPVARLNTSYRAPTPRRGSRVSHAGSPALSPREPASFAAQRSPPMNPPPDFASPSRIPVPAGRTPHRRAASTLSSPSERRPHTRGGSLTEPPRPPSSSAPVGAGSVDSPRLDPEARRLAARREREERETDEQMAAFNARLRDMIREGKEALGTSFEVEVGDGDGWMDE